MSGGISLAGNETWILPPELISMTMKFTFVKDDSKHRADWCIFNPASLAGSSMACYKLQGQGILLCINKELEAAIIRSLSLSFDRSCVTRVFLCWYGRQTDRTGLAIKWPLSKIFLPTKVSVKYFDTSNIFYNYKWRRRAHKKQCTYWAIKPGQIDTVRVPSIHPYRGNWKRKLEIYNSNNNIRSRQSHDDIKLR